MTDSEGARVYGSVLQFEEECGKPLQRKLRHAKVEGYQHYLTQKAICILSRFSFADSFTQVLKFLYQVLNSNNMHIPIERFIVNIMEEVPLPSLGSVLVTFGENNIGFCRPVDHYPPYAEGPAVQNLFKALDVGKVLEVFAQLALERKVLLVSQYKTLLYQAAVSLSAFLFPISWQHTLIPILPASMLPVIDSPFPFLIGVQTAVLAEAIEIGIIENPA